MDKQAVTVVTGGAKADPANPDTDVAALWTDGLSNPKEQGALMTHPSIADHIPLDRRQEIFQALVEAQDAGMDVPDSLRDVAQKFGTTEAEVPRVVRERLEEQWPPLGNGP